MRDQTKRCIVDIVSNDIAFNLLTYIVFYVLSDQNCLISKNKQRISFEVYS